MLAAAGLVLHFEPANGRLPAIVGGLALMLAVILSLMRRAVGPIARLVELMRRVDPLRPGERIPAPRAESEVSVLTRTFNDMLDRLEAERRESARRSLSEREAERRRIAEELHDQIGQDLTALALQLDRLHKRIDEPLQPRSPTCGAACSRASTTCAASCASCVPRDSTRWDWRPHWRTSPRDWHSGPASGSFARCRRSCRRSTTPTSSSCTASRRRASRTPSATPRPAASRSR